MAHRSPVYCGYGTLAHGQRFLFLEPRRAAVSLVMRIRPPEGYVPSPDYTPPPLSEFFELDWVKHPNARAELLYIRRDKNKHREREVKGAGTGTATGGAPAHVAFPGGRTEESDEGALYTGVFLLSLFYSACHLLMV